MYVFTRASVIGGFLFLIEGNVTQNHIKIALLLFLIPIILYENLVYDRLEYLFPIFRDEHAYIKNIQWPRYGTCAD